MNLGFILGDAVAASAKLDVHLAVGPVAIDHKGVARAAGLRGHVEHRASGVQLRVILEKA